MVYMGKMSTRLQFQGLVPYKKRFMTDPNFVRGGCGLHQNLHRNVHYNRFESASFRSYCWWKKSGEHQLRLVVHPTIYKGFVHPRWCWISSINSMLDIVFSWGFQICLLIVKIHIFDIL